MWPSSAAGARASTARRSIYNRLADMEWDGPIGAIDACGGNMMVRAEAFDRVGGFDPTIIAAEDDELCLRLRSDGWTIARVDAEMGRHDIAMTRFGQWWRRSARAGFAYAEGAARHGRTPERHFVGPVRSVAFWGLALPASAVGLAWPTAGLSLALLAGYPLLWHRIARGRRRRGDSARDARLYAFFCMLGKFPQAAGMVRYAAQHAGGPRAGATLAPRPGPYIEIDHEC